MEKIGLIFTSTVHINRAKSCLVQLNPEERISVYVKSIKQWLDKTSFRICLVENSGYSFPELDEYREKYKDRFIIVTYDEKTIHTPHRYLFENRSKGTSEIFAINVAYQMHQTFFKDSLFIIKITARFFIPDFYDFLVENGFNQNAVMDNINPSILAIRQSNPDRCELFGCHRSLFSFIFNPCMIDDLQRLHQHVEYVYKFRINCINPAQVVVCKEFPIEPTQRGGAPEKYNTI